MTRWHPAAGFLAVTLFALSAPAAETREDFRYAVGPQATLNLSNEYGAIVVKPSAAVRQVTVSATTRSGKVYVAAGQRGNRIEIRTTVLEPLLSGDEGRVDYDVAVPAGTNVSVHAGSGSVMMEGLRGDIEAESESAPVEVRDVAGVHVHVRSLSGDITLTRVRNAHVEIQSQSGEVKLENVSGPLLAVNSTRGNIRYSGDFGFGGRYSLTSHAGDIDVSLPETASVDLTAHSEKGSVRNEVPMFTRGSASVPPPAGRSFAGTSHSGSSTVRLLSFSGRIRVKKQ
ncbi:MAG TPA: DUF4097 family beta strand repeat-containing protein [Terriglobales bacterium]|nr:DUF4097 family beta strand repeat-containing protein [Terriglobales bacterium]